MASAVSWPVNGSGWTVTPCLSRKLAVTTGRLEANILDRVSSHYVAEFTPPATDIDDARMRLKMP